ncbi:MAG: S53 family peptidase [Acidimicrobiales bacterium]|jgi:subtilase family serine protease
MRLRSTAVILATAAAVAAGTAAISAAGQASSIKRGARASGPSPISPSAVIIRPDAIHVGEAFSSPATTAECEQQVHIACYGAGQIRQAYNVWPLYRKGITGAGETIVIVDSYGSPTIKHDLAVFDAQYKLSAPPSFTIIQPAGAVAPYEASSNRVGWAGETTLDVEYAHVMAPGADILLVETPTSENEGTTGFPQIVAAEEYVLSNHLGDVISQSFSATEQTFPTAESLLNLRTAYLDAAADGVTVLAAAGDSGAADVEYNETSYYTYPVTSWPDSDPLVTGIGGTQLHLDGVGNRTAPDSVWNDTYNVATNEYIGGNAGPSPLAGGGGKSVIFSRPSWQAGVAKVVGAHRGVPDISMSAACNGAVNIYQSFAGQAAGWYPTCGTSEATPLFAGVVALADQMAGHPLGVINPALYAMSAAKQPGIVEVTKGDNSVSFTQGGKLMTVTGYPALPGYSLASGVGTVDVAKFVPELVAAVAASSPRPL